MLYGWMKSLIIYLILSGLVLNMAPEKNYKRYISFFMGLIVIIILAEPLSYIFNLSSGDISGFADDMEGYMEDSMDMEERDGMYDYYELSMGESIRYALSEAGYEAERVEIISDEEKRLLRCTVVLPAVSAGSDNALADNREITDEIKKYISDVYNVETDSIYIVRR